MEENFQEDNLQEEIQRLIARNKTDEAIKVLSKVQFSKADRELIILNSRYNRVQEELMLNTISGEEAERKINQINLALLDLSQKMDGTGSALASESMMGFNRQWLWLLVIPLAVLIWYVIPKGQSETTSSNTTENTENTEGTSSAEATTPVTPEPEAKKMKVRFTLSELHVIKDGDDFTDFGGDFYWTIKVNDQTLASRARNNQIELNDGDKHAFGESAVFELSEDDTSTLKLVANIVDADGGTSGGDDSIEIIHTYNMQDLVFPSNNQITGNKRGDDGGNPSVDLSWTLQLLPN